MKPILFSTPMVQAILDGRKTMTRRLVNPQPNGEIKANIPYEFYGTKTERIFTDTKAYLARYSVGDILWVRETWADLRGMGFGNEPQTDKPWNYAFRADTKPGSDGDRARIDYGVKWRPSIFMPREAARIFLRVTKVRAERLQEITEEDARREGAEPIYICPETCNCDHRGSGCPDPAKWETSYKTGFAEVWDSINAKRGYGWDANPWVWVIEFERCEKP